MTSPQNCMKKKLLMQNSYFDIGILVVEKLHKNKKK